MTIVRFINSVGEHVAGTDVDLPDEIADLMIIKGYAEGQLSRDYDEAEHAAIIESHQVVSV